MKFYAWYKIKKMLLLSKKNYQKVSFTINFKSRNFKTLIYSLYNIIRTILKKKMDLKTQFIHGPFNFNVNQPTT